MTSSPPRVQILNADLRLSLGEGPVWEREGGLLYFVDIEQDTVLRIHLSTGEVDMRTVRRPSAIGLCRSGRLIIACQVGVVLFDFESGEVSPICNPIAHNPLARLNDGKVAPDGSFWVGSMQNNIAEDGQPVELNSNIGGLFRVASDGHVSELMPETLGIFNTLAWSPNQQDFLFADSLSGTLFSTVQKKDGTLGPTKQFNNDCPFGVPDGSAMDKEGYLWNARWGGSCVVRFDPSGKIDRTVSIPATNVTSCCFGGPDMKTLFVTTARSGLSTQAIDENPNEGALFAVDCGVRGMPIPAFQD
ncbi:SMP-30/gluconolactonase/LRE family protein [Ruegeria sp. HKCCD8929]|uniref:SMP-30/gluconolactonase/LRE family protein n=1 Tax=Ruegeria sp. HKCCD8929 TaxID=2683006 RepID=UPI00211215D6|nr:SMP-30/gluconolactonase/LRE family protein [Ruegeria sp. HKCCD8929]